MKSVPWCRANQARSASASSTRWAGMDSSTRGMDSFSGHTIASEIGRQGVAMIGDDADGGAAAKGTQPALATGAGNPAPLPLAAVDSGRLYWKDSSFGGRCSLLSALRSRRERRTPGSRSFRAFSVVAGEGFEPPTSGL